MPTTSDHSARLTWRHRVPLWGASTLLVLLAVGLTVWLTSDSADEVAAPSLTAQESSRLVADVLSSDKARLGRAIAGQPVPDELLTALSSSELALDATTFVGGEDGTATVRGTIRTPEGGTVPVVAYLVHVDGEWRLGELTPVDEPASAGSPS
jgi:hypothetical protein